MSRIALLIDVCATLALGGLGVLCACVMRRYTTLSARNLYAFDADLYGSVTTADLR